MDTTNNDKIRNLIADLSSELMKSDCPFVIAYQDKDGKVNTFDWIGSYGTDLSLLDRDIKWILKCMAPYCKLFK